MLHDCYTHKKNQAKCALCDWCVVKRYYLQDFCNFALECYLVVWTIALLAITPWPIFKVMGEWGCQTNVVIFCLIVITLVVISQVYSNGERKTSLIILGIPETHWLTHGWDISLMFYSLMELWWSPGTLVTPQKHWDYSTRHAKTPIGDTWPSTTWLRSVWIQTMRPLEGRCLTLWRVESEIVYTLYWTCHNCIGKADICISTGLGERDDVHCIT